jgi:hypothetical protein
MAKVKVRMKVCDNTHIIEVTQDQEGGYDLRIESTCPKAVALAESLKKLTMEDLVDKRNGRIHRTFIESDMSSNCLVASGIVTAAWLEAGLISKRLMSSKGANDVEYIGD